MNQDSEFKSDDKSQISQLPKLDQKEEVIKENVEVKSQDWLSENEENNKDKSKNEENKTESKTNSKKSGNTNKAIEKNEDDKTKEEEKEDKEKEAKIKLKNGFRTRK